MPVKGFYMLQILSRPYKGYRTVIVVTATHTTIFITIITDG